MKVNYIIYILLISIFSFISCTDEKITYNPFDPSHPELGEGEFLLDVNLESFGNRTRDISFSEGATVRINSVWVGAFDIEDGTCVASEHTSMDYAIVAAGEESHGIIRVKLDAPSQSYGDKYFMVVVANYRDVKGIRITSDIVDQQAVEEKDLKTLLSEVKTWDDFNEIGVETESAYANNHNQDSPLLAGFLNNKKTYNSSNPSNTHVKVDQYRTAKNNEDQDETKNNEDQDKKGAVYFSPEYLMDQQTKLKDALTIGYNGDIGKYVALGENDQPLEELNHTVFFRRLVANINVNIVPGDNSPIKVSWVQYQRHNMPKIVYIIERKMLDAKGNFPKDGKLSPNIADINPAIGYYSDDENKWLEGPNQNSDGSWSFSFQHFANKHWARNANLIDYNEREDFVMVKDEKTGEERKIFNALTSYDGSPENIVVNDINNYAGYFVLKLHMIDEENNRCAEAEYTVHEGYTSDEEGYGIDVDETNSEKISKRLRDFSTARNINYNYNIRINNFNNIITNVNGGQDQKHYANQGGRVWQIKYANEQNDNHTVHYNASTGDYTGAIEPQGGRFLNAIYLDTKEGQTTDIAFRLLGYTKHATNSNGDELSPQIAGYNFNFPKESFEWLKGLWPESAGNKSHYFYIDEKDGSTLTVTSLPEDLLGGVTIYEAGSSENGMNLVRFIETYNQKEVKDKYFDIVIKESDVPSAPVSNKKDFIRALFIADRNGKDDIDGCTNMVTIYAAVQDPSTYKTFDAEPVYSGEQYQRWKDNWNLENKNKSENYLIHYAQSFSGLANDSWRGSVNSIVNLGFEIKENLGATSYRIYVNPEDGTTNTHTQLFTNVDSENGYIVLPLNTSGFKAGTYDIVLALENVPSDQEKGKIPLTFRNSLIIHDTKWSFSDSYPWTALTNSALFNNETVNKGTESSKKIYSKPYNYFAEYYGLEMAYYSIKEDALNSTSGYFTSFIDFDGISDGPTDGKPFYLKFKVVKNGTLKLLMTGTNKDTDYRDQTGKTIHIYVDGTEKGPITTFPNGLYTKNDINNITRTFNITGVKEEGSEIIICNDFTNKSGVRFYGVEYVPNN